MKTKNLATIFKMPACSPYPLTWPSSCGRLLQTLGELPPAVVGEPSSHGYAMATGLPFSTPPALGLPSAGLPDSSGTQPSSPWHRAKTGQPTVFIISMFCLDFSFPDFLSCDSFIKEEPWPSLTRLLLSHYCTLGTLTEMHIALFIPRKPFKGLDHWALALAIQRVIALRLGKWLWELSLVFLWKWFIS